MVTRLSAVKGALLAALVTAPLAFQPALAAKEGESFKDWSVKCEKPQGADKEICFLVQEINVKDSKQRLLTMAVGYLGAEKDKKQPGAFFTVPLGVFIPAGIAMQVDENKETAVRMMFQRCDPGGCRAAMPLDDKMISALKGGQTAKVLFQDGSQKPVGAAISLSGFSAGFAAVKP